MASHPSTRMKPAAPRAGHAVWPDLAKGLGIVLVVTGHAWRGIAEAGLMPQDALFHAVDDAIYAFHMPLFFFLSGWFFPQLLRREGPADLLGRIGWRLFYPLCLWTYGFIAVKALAGSAANAPVAWSEMLRLPVPGYQHLWFLWALIVIQLVAVAVRPLAVRAMAPVMAGMLALACLLYLGDLLPPSGIFNGAERSAPFFFLGALLGLGRGVPASGRAALIAGAAFVAADGLAIWRGDALGRPGHLLSGAVALLAVLVLLRRWEGVGTAARLARGLALLGQASFSIYLMHTIFSGGLRVVLMRLGIENVPVHLLLGVGIGLAAPLLVHAPAVPAAVARGLGLGPKIALRAARPRAAAAPPGHSQ